MAEYVCFLYFENCVDLSFFAAARLYMAGGQTDAGHSFRDLLCLDLSQVQRKWRRLEDYPIPLAVTGQFYGWHMKVRDDKAYLFTGRPELDFYDLLAERWSSVMTTYVPTAEDRYAGVEGDWPYPGFRVVEAAVELAHDKLLVFGGTHKGSALGCNLLMELDLTSNTWKRLSGFVITPLWGHRSLPGPRKAAASWLNGNQDTLHILFGLSDRHTAQLEHQSHGAQDSYAYDDLWSWDIKSHGWSKKKLCGNPPSPRCEMAYCYVCATLFRILQVLKLYYRIENWTFWSPLVVTIPRFQQLIWARTKRSPIRTTLTRLQCAMKHINGGIFCRPGSQRIGLMLDLSRMKVLAEPIFWGGLLTQITFQVGPNFFPKVWETCGSFVLTFPGALSIKLNISGNSM